MPRSGTLFLFLLVLVSHVSHAQTLNLLTWEAYFSDAVIRQWEEETGASINQVFFDKDEVRNTILFSSEATGIDIVAQPPGKRLQSLALLSGGERSLTAVALLFAILKVNPTPFCLLDEVDAALDEANVVRFREELKRLARETQAIVITHNRGTTEIADALYGVSMRDDGVSQVLSLRLDPEERAAGD